MSVVVWLILGLLVGLLSSLIAVGTHRDLAANVAVASVGALLGGFLSSILDGLDVTGIDPTSLIMSLLGATLMVALLRVVPPTDAYE
jgi:uncharacterized membrane protein YeaQ/YmgE (transglycosylase-associated protein family)